MQNVPFKVKVKLLIIMLEILTLFQQEMNNKTLAVGIGVTQNWGKARSREV